MKRQFWAIGTVAVLMIALVYLSRPHYSDRHYSTHMSIHRARNLMEGCVEYRRNPQSGGKYPASLSDLFHPPFKGGPYLADPDHDVIDGYGERLRYAVIINGQGEEEAYAWAERTKSGKTHLVGAKATVDATVVIFGLPE